MRKTANHLWSRKMRDAAGAAALVAFLAGMSGSAQAGEAGQAGTSREEGTPGASSGTEAANQVQPLSLAEAVLLARENSPAILESEANRQMARAAKREAWLTYLPAVQIRQVALRTNSPGDAFGLQLMQERFSLGLMMEPNDPNDPDDLDHFSTEFEATMPLFTGWELESGIKQAGKMTEAATAMRQHVESAVSLGVAQAYINALLADRFVALGEQALETTVKHVDQAQAFHDAGMIVESDLLQAQVQKSRMEENLIRARNGSSLARAGLNRVMGLDQAGDYRLISEPGSPEPQTTSLEQALDLAHDRRGDLRAMEAKAEAAGAAVGRARSEYFPKIGLMAKYNISDDRIFGDHGDSYTVAAQAEWKVWNWGQTQARISRSKSEEKAVEQSRRAYLHQVEFEVRQAWQGLEEARARHEVTQGAVAAAEKALAIVEQRFEKGVAKMTDLLDSETMAHEARVREAQARFDLQLSIRTLNFAVGAAPVPEVSQ